MIKIKKATTEKITDQKWNTGEPEEPESLTTSLHRDGNQKNHRLEKLSNWENQGHKNNNERLEKDKQLLEPETGKLRNWDNQSHE